MSVTTAPPPPARRTSWMDILGSGIVRGIVGAVVGYVIFYLIGRRIGNTIPYVADLDQNDPAIFIGYLGAIAGWLAGLGFLAYPLRRMAGAPADIGSDRHGGGSMRYLGLCTDHKVIGLQYLGAVGVLFFIAGLNAMLIRIELLRPASPIYSPGQYLTIVTLHGTMMIMIMSAVVVGPFGHYLMPLMIGSGRMAFPRLEALSFWLVPIAGAILMSSVDFGGMAIGWTGYPTLANQANAGIDGYIVAFALIAFAMILNGLNILATVIHMRAPGMSWSRLPMFVWGIVATGALMALAPMVFVAALVMEALDRTASTNFYVASGGGSPFLYENLFWFFGHPEVYILALPGFGIVLELLPVFSRKPLWGYRLGVAGILGDAILSFAVWQHHLFVSGINSNLRPFYMLTTELISVPTGLIFLVGLGTIWGGKLRFEVPMLFSLAFFFNFLIGGISGVFLSDVPSDVTLHGSYFVMAHFHYTIMGGLVFAFFAGIYYWLPKMTGLQLNQRLAKWHFWTMFIFFNTTFLPLFAAGMLNMPRRVNTYDPDLRGLNIWVSISAFLLGISMLIFLFNLVWSLAFVRRPAEQNPWRSRGLEWQLPTPVPADPFLEPPVIEDAPYGYGDPRSVPVIDPVPESP
jgi:cytochrome c oxidase subunit 1